MSTMNTSERRMRSVLAFLLTVLGGLLILTGLDMGWRGVLVLLGVAVYVGGVHAQVELRR